MCSYEFVFAELYKCHHLLCRIYSCFTGAEGMHDSQWEWDGVVAVAGQEVGKDGFHGGFLLHLTVNGAQQVSLKYI